MTLPAGRLEMLLPVPKMPIFACDSTIQVGRFGCEVAPARPLAREPHDRQNNQQASHEDGCSKDPHQL
jgi:hypothetical protein